MAIFIDPRPKETTHCTTGISGFPAIDFFGDLGEDVHLNEPVNVFYPHLIDWHTGFGGWTFYAHGLETGNVYFFTHLGDRNQAQAGKYEIGALLGRLTDSAAHAALINGAHVHVGSTGWPDPPGNNCGIPPAALIGSKGEAISTTGPPVKHASTVAVASSSVPSIDSHLTDAWHRFTHQVAVTVPSSAHFTNVLTRGFRRVVS